MRVLYDFHLLPRDYLALDVKSKAFIVACLLIADEEAKKEQEEHEKKIKRAK